MRSKLRTATLTFFAVSAQKMQRAPQGTNHPRDTSGLWKTAVGETNYDVVRSEFCEFSATKGLPRYKLQSSLGAWSFGCLQNELLTSLVTSLQMQKPSFSCCPAK